MYVSATCFETFHTASIMSLSKALKVQTDKACMLVGKIVKTSKIESYEINRNEREYFIVTLCDADTIIIAKIRIYISKNNKPSSQRRENLPFQRCGAKIRKRTVLVCLDLKTCRAPKNNFTDSCWSRTEST